jgi:hypothetical protein
VLVGSLKTGLLAGGQYENESESKMDANGVYLVGSEKTGARLCDNSDGASRL